MARYKIIPWFREQKAKLPLVTKDLSGKTVLVVGANIGLGLEASRHFARMKPERLILGCRNVEKGEAAANDIEESTGFKPEVIYVDLGDFSTIPAFIEKLDNDGKGKVDIAICNAGVNMQKWQATKDGWESSLQINHLGTSLLALLLLPILSRSKSTESSPRLTIVSSDAHYFVTLKWFQEDAKNVLEALNDEKTAIMARRYFITKLLNVLFTRALAERLPKDASLGVDTVHPGLCKSQMTGLLVEGTSFIIRWLLTWVMYMFARTTEEGSRTLVHAALDGSNKDIQGKYLNSCHIDEESDLVISKEGKVLQDRIWDETLEVLYKVHPQLKDVISKQLR